MIPNKPTMLALLLCLAAGFALPPAAQSRQAAPPAEAPALDETPRPAQQYGVGLRFRGLFVPKSIFERYVDVAPSGLSRPGLGLEATRRRGNFEAIVGLAWANLSLKDGIWLDDPDHNPSLVEFDNFSWMSLDLTAVWLEPLREDVALRYGMGVGLGIVLGDILETDYVCEGNRYDLDSCRQSPTAEDIRHSYRDLPPLLPVFNALLGLQYAPSPQVAINLDGGLHTAFFLGMSVVIYFE